MSTIARIYRVVAASLRTLVRDRQNAKPRDWVIGAVVAVLGYGVIADMASPGPQPEEPRGLLDADIAATAVDTDVPPTGASNTATPTRTPNPTSTTAPKQLRTATPRATTAPTDTPEPTLPPTTAAPAIPDLNPDEDRDCNEFVNREEAQAYWEHHRNQDRPNPGRLDGNSNGIVCEDPDRSAPAAAPVVAPAPQPLMQAQPSRPCDTGLKCTDFSSKAEMLAWWNACGRPSKYDRNGDGDPCESLR